MIKDNYNKVTHLEDLPKIEFNLILIIHIFSLYYSRRLKVTII